MQELGLNRSMGCKAACSCLHCAKGCITATCGVMKEAANTCDHTGCNGKYSSHW